jgi:hypothetical protein
MIELSPKIYLMTSSMSLAGYSAFLLAIQATAFRKSERELNEE